MKKIDLDTLKMNLKFMKDHMKDQQKREKAFTAFVKAVAFQVDKVAPVTDSNFRLRPILPKKATKEQKQQYDEILEKIKDRDVAKGQIKKLKAVLKKLCPDTQARLARDEEYGRDSLFPFICPTGKKFDLVPLMLKQCEGALLAITYDEESLEQLFFLGLAGVYVTYTGQPILYNHGGEPSNGDIFIKFCDAAYSHTGKYLSISTIRDRVRQYVYTDAPLSADNQTGRKYHPKSKKHTPPKRQIKHVEGTFEGRPIQSLELENTETAPKNIKK